VIDLGELSRRTGLEESLVRFYESEYGAELPEKVLQGGSLFFTEEAVAAFLKVHARHHPGAEASGAPAREGYGRVLAVTSGKGGVGKSNIALNLALEFQRQGKMALVLDADLGMANIHLLAGIEPGYTLGDYLKSGIKAADIISQGPEGIGIVPGGAGVLALADVTGAQRRRLLRALSEMERAVDVVIVDTGAGMTAGVRDFLRAADEILFVLTPDITSLADAYGLLKALHNEGYKGQLYSVINMVRTLRQAAEVSKRFSACAWDFLGRRVENMAYILRDSTVSAAIARRIPYSVYAPKSRVSANTRNLAVSLLREENPQLKTSSAFKRYMKMCQDLE